MPLYVGNSFNTASVSTERTNNTQHNTNHHETKLWDGVKEFFYSTHLEEAQQCIDKLSQHDELQLAPEEIKDIFTKLSELISPGWKGQLHIESDNVSNEYIMCKKNGGVLFAIKVSVPVDVQSEMNVDATSSFRLAKEILKLYPPDTKNSLDNIDRLIVFGDSLSDSKGRMFEKTHHIFPSYSQYYEGRFTNGFVWSDFLSSPSFLKKEIINYSEGGSTSASYSCFNFVGDFLSNLDKQMKSYSPSNKDLAIFLLGANDYITLHKSNVVTVVEQQIHDIEKILSRGVKNILVMGLPDLSATPSAKLSDEKEIMKDATVAHNALLKSKVNELNKAYPKSNVLYFDTFSAFNKISEVAHEIGYDTNNSYTEHGYIHRLDEKDPRLNIRPQYIYNDHVHPTQEVHHCFATMLESFILNNYGTATHMKPETQKHANR